MKAMTLELRSSSLSYEEEEISWFMIGAGSVRIHLHFKHRRKDLGLT